MKNTEIELLQIQINALKKIIISMGDVLIDRLGEGFINDVEHSFGELVSSQTENAHTAEELIALLSSLPTSKK